MTRDEIIDDTLMLLGKRLKDAYGEETYYSLLVLFPNENEGKTGTGLRTMGGIRGENLPPVLRDIADHIDRSIETGGITTE